jgi:CIC family chloride channel protein
LELLFEEEHHTGYPVVKDGHLVGVVTLEDVRNLPPDARGRGKVGDIASKDIVVAYPDETVHSALDKMHTRHVGRLPVVDRNNPTRILGIISRHDLVRAHEIAAGRPAE